jgi:hypothetical protein
MDGEEDPPSGYPSEPGDDTGAWCGCHVCCCGILHGDGRASTCRGGKKPLADEGGSAEEERHVGGGCIVVAAKVNAWCDVLECSRWCLTYMS